VQLPGALAAQGDQLVCLASLDSTMEEARRRFAPGLAHRIWIVADAQTAGRGRQGRAWVSPPGNLHMTLLLPTSTPMRDQPKLGFAVGVALARAAEVLLPPSASVRLKWPNDLLVDGAKTGGLLLEGLGQGLAVAIGMGVNIVSHPPETQYPATHLCAFAASVTRSMVFDRLADALAEEIDMFANGSGFPVTRQRWLARAAHRGRRIAVRQGAGGQQDGSVEGTFIDIDDDGRLLLDTAAGPVRIAAGDVFPLDK
jgi:BirA family transcriptional regulator, biotin operon repressor / biotin---[acetyl-CoA-carboxylase] ligase